jgi:hypothetical protein
LVDKEKNNGDQSNDILDQLMPSKRFMRHPDKVVANWRTFTTRMIYQCHCCSQETFE